MEHTQYKIHKGIYPSIPQEAQMNIIFKNDVRLITIHTTVCSYVLITWQWLHDCRYKDPDMGNWYPHKLNFNAEEVNKVGNYLSNIIMPSEVK